MQNKLVSPNIFFRNHLIRIWNGLGLLYQTKTAKSQMIPTHFLTHFPTHFLTQLLMMVGPPNQNPILIHLTRAVM